MMKAVNISVAVIALIFLLWFIAPVFYGIRNVGSVLGALVCIAVIFRFGFDGVYQSVKLRLCEHTATTILLRIVQTGAVLFVIYAVVVSGFMLYAMNVKPQQNSTAVVLGAQVKPWGPSTMLRQRINAARDYLAANPDSDAVLTGGKGDDEIMSEAQCMYENLIEAGIESDRLYREDQATDTDQNIRYSLQIIKDNGLNPDITVVTDSYHQLRARIITAKNDPSVKVSACNTHQNHIGLAAYPSFFVREWMAVPVEILK